MDDLLATISQATGAALPTQAAPSAAPQGAPTAFDPTKSYGTPSQMLDNLNHTESSGNQYAVNDKTGAMGPYQFTPSTLAMLRKQGVNFDPFDPQQSRAAADYYIQQLKGQNGGTYQGALKAYGGFVHADPTQYVNKVMNGVQGGSQQVPPTIPGQSSNTAQPAAYSGPNSDLLDTLQSAVNAPAPKATPQQPNAPQPETGALSRFGHGVAGVADTVLGVPGQIAQQGDYALRRAFQQSPEQAQQAAQGDFGGASHPIGNAFGVTNTPGYQGEASQRAVGAVGNVVGQGVNAVANATGAAPEDVSNIAGSLSMLVPGAAHLATPAVRAVAGGVADAARAAGGAVSNAAGAAVNATRAGAAAVGQTARDFTDAVGTVTGMKAPEAPATTNASVAPATQGLAGARGSVGAAGTSFAQQAAAEGVPDALVQKIASAEKNGALNPVAAGRHIEAGSLPVPVELTAGQASGDVQMLSNEMNSRGKNPELANRFNAQNGQISDNLTAIRDQVSPDVNVPSGAPTGQSLVDAYKEMDGPIRDQIAEQYDHAIGLDGTAALVDASGAMRTFESQIGPTRFNALPSRVQQIFADAKNNSVTLPAHFDQSYGSTRAMNARDIMDIDQTLSGAIAEAKSPTVQHDIGRLRDSILGAPIDPSAGPEAVAAFKTAQASARARFQAMDTDPAYKAAVNDVVPQGEPSPLADQFAQKYIAGGKTANVQNMMQNLSNDPVNSQLIASALVDHIRAQAGVDLRTGSGNISQAGLNKAIQNLGDKTRIVLGPDASQTVEKLGNVARYTQEQPRGSFVNNSNTAVTLIGHAGSLAKSTVERGVNAVVPGAQLGSWARESLANRANAREVTRSLEPGAGLSAVPLNQLIKNKRGAP